MATVPTTIKKTRGMNDQSGALAAKQLNEAVHELMNQLTVIDLCVFQLCSTTRPNIGSPLATLERVTESAIQSARQLSERIFVSDPTRT